MSAYKEVRALQAWLRRDKKRYRPSTDPLFLRRDAVQYANDCAFCNPAPGKKDDPKERERWASRWLERFRSTEGGRAMVVDAEAEASRALANSNEARERGRAAEAERHLAASQRWLDKANDLRGWGE